MESIPSTVNAGKETLLDKIHAPEEAKQGFRHHLQVWLQTIPMKNEQGHIYLHARLF